jgi:hypothetical protein
MSHRGCGKQQGAPGLARVGRTLLSVAFDFAVDSECPEGDAVWMPTSRKGREKWGTRIFRELTAENWFYFAATFTPCELAA